MSGYGKAMAWMDTQGGWQQQQQGSGRGGGRGGGRGNGRGSGRGVGQGEQGIGRGNSHQPTPYKRYDNWNYCWSCGHDVPEWHNSKTCNNCCPGHQEGATKQNTMGGNTRQQHKMILPSVPMHPRFGQQQQQQAYNTYHPAPSTMPHVMPPQFTPHRQP